MRSHGQGGPGGLSPRWIRAACRTVRSATTYVHYTALEVRHAVTAAMGSHGVDTASDTTACKARIGASHCTSSWSGTRTAENCAQLVSDAPGSTCG